MNTDLNRGTARCSVQPGSFTENHNQAGGKPAVPSGDRLPAIVFDEDLAWKQPVSAYSVNRPVRSPASSESGRKHHSFKAFLSIVVILLSLFGVCMLTIVMMPQTLGYFWTDFNNYAFINGQIVRYDADVMKEFKNNSAYLDVDTIYPGVFIDGIHLGGKTKEEARDYLLGFSAETIHPFSVTVHVGDQSWRLDETNIPVSRDLGNLIEQAYAVGRRNTVDTQGTSTAPFSARIDAALQLRTSFEKRTTTVTYDCEAVKALVGKIAEYVYREPVNAQIKSFDFNTRTFSFTDSQPGCSIDAEILYEQVTQALDRWETDAVVTADVQITEPTVTTEALKNGFNLIAAFTTETTKDKNRNTNIDLACKAINGTALMPGETFSFNKATGERTLAKGYKEAGAISGGQSIDEVGGGICQVSSTIFNAAARANLTIVSRSPHAWPSTYVNIGEDATVNWPNLDFKFRNDTDSPVFLITYYKNRKMTAEIWGMTLGKGVTIGLESKVTKKTNAPTEIKYVYNPSLAYGSSETTVKARPGYEVETYKVWYLDGKETKREFFYKSTYKTYQQVVEFNSGDHSEDYANNYSW